MRGVRRMTTPGWSLELETLDQLLGGDMRLDIVRKVWPDDERFVVGIKALVVAGDVLLLTSGIAEVPNWRWRQLFDDGLVLTELGGFSLRLTDQGSARIE